jgi:hypothetical protein
VTKRRRDGETGSRIEHQTERWRDGEMEGDIGGRGERVTGMLIRSVQKNFSCKRDKRERENDWPLLESEEKQSSVEKDGKEV